MRTEPPAGDAQSAGDSGLARKVTPGLLLVMVIGNVLGAGIYVVTGEVAGEVGGATWLAFAIAFVVAALSALSLCELVTKYPGATGVALYVDTAFRKPMLTFVVGFTVLASGLTSAATASRAFGGDYLREFASVDTTLAAAGFLLALALANYIGVVFSLRANLLMTVIEVGGLIIVMIAGALVLSSGDGDLTRPLNLTGDGQLVPVVLLSGAAIAFFSFLGFEDVANMSEEVQRPRISFPVALFGGLAVTATIYLLVTFIAVAAVGPERLEASTAPLLAVVDQSPLGVSSEFFAAIALIAVANTALANLVMGSRLLYGMARRGLVPAVFGKVDRNRSTPWVAVIATGLVAFLLAATGDLGALARTTVLLLLSVLILMNVSAIRLRSDAVSHAHFVAPVWAAWLGAATCGALIVNQTARDGWGEPLRAGLVVAVGAVVYVLEARRQEA